MRREQNQNGTDSHWGHSYISDRTYRGPIALHVEAVREHATCGGFPEKGVAQVTRVIDPRPPSLPDAGGHYLRTDDAMRTNDMLNREGGARRIVRRGGVWIVGLVVVACARGDNAGAGDTASARLDDSASAAAAEVAASPSGTDTTQGATTSAAGAVASGNTAAGAADTLRDTATTKPPTPETAAQRRKAGAVAATRARTTNTAATSATSTATSDTATGASAAAPAETATTQVAATSDTDSVTQGSAAGQVESQQATPAGQSGAQQQGGGDKMLVSEEVYNGWKVYNSNCNRCQGDEVIAAAGGIAPDLRQSVESGRINHDSFLQTVKDGRIEKGMPPWKDLLSEKQIEDTWQYVKARADKALPPGRPKRKDA